MAWVVARPPVGYERRDMSSTPKRKRKATGDPPPVQEPEVRAAGGRGVQQHVSRGDDLRNRTDRGVRVVGRGGRDLAQVGVQRGCAAREFDLAVEVEPGDCFADVQRFGRQHERRARLTDRQRLMLNVVRAVHGQPEVPPTFAVVVTIRLRGDTTGFTTY